MSPLLVFVVLAALAGILWAPNVCAVMAEQGKRTVTDRTGRTVSIPTDPRRIACFYGPSYDRAFLLGAADRVAARTLKHPPWAHKLNPNLRNIPLIASYNDPDVERMLSMGLDLVFYWAWPQQIERMSSAGIPVLCSFSPTANPVTLDGFINQFKEDIRFYGNMLGGEAIKTAEDYCTYFDEKLKNIISVTSRIPPAARPKYYSVRGHNVFATEGRYTTGHWLSEIAGATLVSKGINNYFVDTTMEQIIAWNPDVIVVGSYSPIDPILTDARWGSIKAVREKRVHHIPEGVFFWDHAGTEIVLFAMYLAKTFHPDKFSDLDMKKEVKEFYSRFYHYALTDDDADRILKHLPPEGFDKHTSSLDGF